MVLEGNLTTKLFTYNTANQITNASFSYDTNGNLTSDGTLNYTFDSENRLTAVKRVSDNHTIAAYEYDYLGRRIKSTEETQTTYFHYDGNDYHVIAESDSSGTVTARYYYDDKGQLVSMQKSGQMYYYQYNAHGDVISLTNSSGQVINTYSYDPWGNILSVNEQIANPYRYAGYRYDSSTGLYYLWHRYYSPGLGRFLTKDLDPGDLKNPQNLNPYIYCLDNPVNRIDPTGLFAWDDLGMWDRALNTVAAVTATAAVVVGAVGIATGNLELEPVAAGLALTATIATGLDMAVTGVRWQRGEITREEAITSLAFSGMGLGFGVGSSFAKSGSKLALDIFSMSRAHGSAVFSWVPWDHSGLKRSKCSNHR